MELKRFFTTETGKIIMSFLLGLGLATLFKKTCDGVDCLVFKAPSLEDIKKKKYKYGNKCFQYNMDSVICDNKKKIVEFA
jgi:hypothetical protein